jgi:AraC family transcriptional regulator, exoenzyme S synthesis regulatory protein ExsA
MTIQLLPNDLGSDSKKQLYLFDYNIDKANLKNKINLTQNVFSFLIHGTKEVITNKKTIVIQNNQFLIIKAGNCLMTENLSDDKNYQSILFFFTNEMVYDFIRKNKIILKKNQETNPYIVCEYDVYILNFIKSLTHISKQEASFQKKMLQVKFDEIMYYLVHKNGNSFLEQFQIISNVYNPHFENVVQNNKFNHLTIQELAFLCNMSSSTFKRNFEKKYKTSPIKWFQDKRLEQSAFLLQTKSNRPTDIFSISGFENLSSFTQAFKQKFGITPKQFQLKNELL